MISILKRHKRKKREECRKNKVGLTVDLTSSQDQFQCPWVQSLIEVVLMKL